MPRSATTAELAVMASPSFHVSERVLVQDDELNWRDLSNIVGFDWFAGYEVDIDSDHPVASATVHVRRESDESDFTVEHLIPQAGDRLVTSTGDVIALFALPVRLSLSPLVDSIANRTADGTAFQTIVDAGHALRIERAATAYGVAPVSGDWKRIFEGEIDIVDLEQEPITVEARGLGLELVDRWTAASATLDYTLSPQPIETVVQTILDALYVPYGDTAPTLYTPVSPLFEITTFAYDIESGADILDRLLGVIAWDLRYVWDDGTASYRLTLYDPQRTKTTPDFVIGPDQYLTVDALKIDRTLVRNSISVRAGDPPIAAGLAEDPTSIARYGIRPIVVTEASDSPINTGPEAQRMADAMLVDLKDPKADQSVTLLVFWPVEIYDLLQFQPNGVHYDTAQRFAVVRIRHTCQLRGDHTESRTIVDTRGTPALGQRRWLARNRNNTANAYKTSAIADGSARATQAINDAMRLRDQRRQQQVSVGSINSVQTSRPLSSTGNGVDAQITIAAHTVRFGFGSVSYSSGMITPLVPGTLYYIYADDSTFAGGAVAYVATTTVEDVVADNGRYFVGKITTPAGVGSSSQSGGGGGSQTLH